MTDHRLVVKGLVEQNLGESANRSGFVLHSGWSTLRPGKLYVIGFNPGGNPDGISQTILESLAGHSDTESTHTEAWRNHEVGEAPFQRRVSEMVELLGEKTESVFATNAIFERSVDKNGINNPWAAWEKCWPVHQYFLSIVRPKIILCLGNGAGLSSLRFLQYKMPGQPRMVQCSNTESFRDGKIVRGVLNLAQPSSLKVILLGAPHPSRYPVTQNFAAFVSQQVEDGWPG